MGHIIEHIPTQDLLNLLIQCTKALKPNGKMIILTPNIAHPPVLEDFWLISPRSALSNEIGSIHTTITGPNGKRVWLSKSQL